MLSARVRPRARLCYTIDDDHARARGKQVGAGRSSLLRLSVEGSAVEQQRPNGLSSVFFSSAATRYSYIQQICYVWSRNLNIIFHCTLSVCALPEWLISDFHSCQRAAGESCWSRVCTLTAVRAGRGGKSLAYSVPCSPSAHGMHFIAIIFTFTASARM